jgi:hypothetical protein
MNLNFPATLLGHLGALGEPFVTCGKGRADTSPFSKRSLEKSAKFGTWQDNFPSGATDTESLSLLVETRAVCKIRQ